MYIAMNRFSIVKGNELEFTNRWKNRQTHLKEFDGFIEFKLLRCDTTENDATTLFATHTVWKTKADFINWTKSEQFRDSHKTAGTGKLLMTGAPKFEGFDTILSE